VIEFVFENSLNPLKVTITFASSSWPPLHTIQSDRDCSGTESNVILINNNFIQKNECNPTSPNPRSIGPAGKLDTDSARGDQG
jgi:hypothetical protein